MSSKQKMRDEHLSSELPSPKVMRNGSLARSTAGSPNMLPTGSVSKYKKLPRHAQRSMLSDVKKIAKNLETHLDSGSVRQCWAMGVAAAADGGGGTSSQHAAVETPPQRQRQSRRFTSSPSPEPLHGNPHHPARDGSRPSLALAAFSPSK
jgi:hypothetical protein